MANAEFITLESVKHIRSLPAEDSRLLCQKLSVARFLPCLWDNRVKNLDPKTLEKAHSCTTYQYIHLVWSVLPKLSTYSLSLFLPLPEINLPDMVITEMKVQSPPEISSIIQHLKFLLVHPEYEHEIDSILQYLNDKSNEITDNDKKQLQSLPLFALNSFTKLPSKKNLLDLKQILLGLLVFLEPKVDMAPYFYPIPGKYKRYSDLLNVLEIYKEPNIYDYFAVLNTITKNSKKE